MKRFLQRAFIVLWTAFGCAGLGAFIGQQWLDGELDQYRWSKPTVRVIGTENGASHQECATPPTSMDAFYRALRSAHGKDLRAFVQRLMRCANSEEQRLAFVTMLVEAKRRGDPMAERAVEAAAAASCSTLSVIADTAPEQRSATIGACSDIAVQYAASMDSAADASRAQVFRFAQRLALVEADVADEAVSAAFCEDAADLPPDVYARISAVRTNLPALVASTCEEE